MYVYICVCVCVCVCVCNLLDSSELLLSTFNLHHTIEKMQSETSLKICFNTKWSGFSYYIEKWENEPAFSHIPVLLLP